MKVFTIGRLELESRTQSQKDWQPRESGVLQFRHKKPTLLLPTIPAGGILAKAMTRALPRMAESRGQESEGQEATLDQMFQMWRPHFQSGGDTRLGARFISLVMEGEYVRCVSSELSALVKVISPSIPNQWRLTLTWDGGMNTTENLEWLFKFETYYPATLTKGKTLVS